MKQPVSTNHIVAFDELPNSSLVRLKQLLATAVIPFSATTAWRRVHEGTFPRPIRISPQVTAWRVGEIRDWLRSPGSYVVDAKGSPFPKQGISKGGSK